MQDGIRDLGMTPSMKTGPSGQSGRAAFSTITAFFLSLLLFSASFAARAVGAEPQSDATSGTVRVLVAEDFAKKPLPRSEVRLVSDDRVYTGRTKVDGSVDFSGVVVGVYGIKVQAADYAFTRDDVVTVRIGESQTRTVLGTRTTLRRIGSVRARSTPAPSAARSLDGNDTGSLIAGNVGSAASSLPSIGTDGFGGLTINNQGVGQTSATINGAPLFPSGSNTQLGLFSSDAFSSASVDPNGVAGSPGGALNFRTYDPTLDWAGLAQQRGASFGSVASSDLIRGTAGRLGVAFSHSQTDSSLQFDGKTFADTSGLLYGHDATQRNTTDITTLRYGFDPNHVGLLDIGRIASAIPLICTFQSGPLPCGYGPGNRSTQEYGFVQFRDQLQLDRANLDLHLFSTRLSSAFEDRNETIEGTWIGSAGNTTIDRIGALATIGFSLTPRRAASLVLQATQDTALIGGATVQREPIPPSKTSISSAKLKLPIVANTRFDFTVSGGVNSGYGTTRPTLGAETSYRLTGRDSLGASYSNGEIPSKAFTFNGAAQPESVQPDCASGRAIVGGPSSAGDVGSTATLRTTLKHNGSGYTLSLDAFRTSAANVSVSAALPGSTLGALQLPSNFYARASQFAGSECGSPFALDPHTIYFSRSAIVQQQLTDGVNLGISADITPRSTLTASYSLARARAFGASPLFAPGSTLVAGDQLPGRPLAQYRLTGKLAISRAITLLAEAKGVSGNNQYGSKPFAQINAGVRIRAAAADIVASVQNIGNVHGNAFTGFAPFPTIAQSLAPRTYGLNIRLALGRQNIDRADYLSQPFGFNGGYGYEPLEFEARPESGWLSPRTDSPFCGPEKLAIATGYERAIQAFLRELNAQPPDGNDLRAVRPEIYEAMTLRVASGGASPTLQVEFTPGKARSFGPFISCSRLHEGAVDKAHKLGLYIPGWRERESRKTLTLYYSERVGLYFAPQPLDDGSVDRDFKPPGFSNKRGNARFEIVEAYCPARVRDPVRDTVEALHRYIDTYYDGHHPNAPDGFAIVAHAAKSETWLEIKPDDLSFFQTLENCLDIPYVNGKEITARGLGGADFPSFNFAPAVGFYTKAIEFNKSKP